MPERWINVALVADVAEGTTHRVDFAGEAVCLYNLEGEFCATQDTCTHSLGSLADGYIDGDLIECPLHQAAFDIRTGRVMSPPATEPLRVYPTRIVGDSIQLLAAALPEAE